MVEVVALVPEEGGLTTTAVHVPGLEKVCPPYPQGVRVGDLLFTSGPYGVDPETGRVPTRLAEVNDEGAAHLTSGSYHIDVSLEAFKAQMALVRSNSKRLLESQGASLTDMLRLQPLHQRGDGGRRRLRTALRVSTTWTRERRPPSPASPWARGV